MEPGSMFALGIVLTIVGSVILFGGEILLGIWKHNLQNDISEDA